MPKQRKRGTIRGGHRAMDYHDLPAFMQRLAANSDQSARALEVTILTFARTIEVQNMRWSQLDFESGVWDLGTLDTRTNGSSARHYPGKRSPICARPMRAA
jgi:integrase